MKSDLIQVSSNFNQSELIIFKVNFILIKEVTSKFVPKYL